MKRVANFLKYKGAKKVYYLIVPGEVNGKKVKGVDDYFAAGGTLEGLKAVRTTKEPPDLVTVSEFIDTKVAEIVAADVMTDRYIWVAGLNWLRWNGKVWASVSEVEMTEAIRIYMVQRLTSAAENMKADYGNPDVVKGWLKYQNKGSLSAIRDLGRGLVERKIDELDSEANWVNTPSGVVDTVTKEVLRHDPVHLMTTMTKGAYRPGFKHPDWQKALEVLDEPEREYLRLRIGQVITGHPTPDGVVPILQGSGENGKSLLITDGLVPALGGYASMASRKLFQSTKGSEHSTERAELRGKRLLIAEELTEGRSIDVAALKQITDVGMITARYIRQDNFTFKATHSLFVTTNYIPVVNETDHGTWRRLQLVRFPYTFRKPGHVLLTPYDRIGEPNLKARIRANATGQWDAIVTWAIEYYNIEAIDPGRALEPTAWIAEDTGAWRAEADRILGFWLEHAVASADWGMVCSEVLDAFNDWLVENGHTKWTKETFVTRFLQHSVSVHHGIERKQVRTKGRNIWRYGRWGFAGHSELKEREWCFLGIRLRS